MTWCLVCDLGRHELCSGYSRPVGGQRELCWCPYPLHSKHPKPLPRRSAPPARMPAVTRVTAPDTGSGGGGLNPT